MKITGIHGQNHRDSARNIADLPVQKIAGEKEPVQRAFMGRMAKKLDCRERPRPYRDWRK